MSAGRFVISTNANWSPAVAYIMTACGCTRAEAFFAYFALLSQIHLDGRGGKVVTLRHDVDQRAQLPGFADALERLGWITFGGTFENEMRWSWKLRKGYVTKLDMAKLVRARKRKGGAK